jgi:hypothetical protein
VCLYHYRQIPAVPHKNAVSKTGRFRPGQNKKRLPCQFDESCTVLVGTSMSPQKKKKEEGGAKFKCNYSRHGKPPRQVFDDKYLELLKQNGWGGGAKKLPNTWADREKTCNDLMRIIQPNLWESVLRGGDSDLFPMAIRRSTFRICFSFGKKVFHGGKSAVKRQSESAETVTFCVSQNCCRILLRGIVCIVLVVFLLFTGSIGHQRKRFRKRFRMTTW